MRKYLLAAAGLALAALPASARALMIAPPSMQQRVAQSDAVVVGKVTGFEDKTVKVERFPGDKEKGEFRIAIVKVEQAPLGAKGLTHVKVAYPLPVMTPPGPGPGRPFRRLPTVNLTKDQEVCLFLKRHPKESFLVAPNYYDVLDKKAPNFAKEVEEVKRYAKLISDPTAGLKAKSPEDRFSTAAMLIVRYRTQTGGMVKQEEVDAKESKLILEALAGADWSQMPRPGRGFQQMNPVMAFGMLGLEPKDGWMQPMNFQQFPEAAKAWLKENAGKYRIKRFVAEK